MQTEPPCFVFLLLFKREGFLQRTPLLILFAQVEFGSIRKLIAFRRSTSGIRTDHIRPLDANFRVVPSQSAFISRMIEIGALIAELSVSLKTKKPCAKPSGI